MFKECLDNDIVPFVVMDSEKSLYIKGLNEWRKGEKGYLQDFCFSMQDEMRARMKYFGIPCSDTIYISKEANDHIRKFIKTSLSERRNQITSPAKQYSISETDISDLENG